MKIKSFLRTNWHWIIFAFCVGCFFVLAQFKYLEGDDWGYTIGPGQSFADFAAFHIRHYLRTNGRALVHLVLTLLLKLPLQAMRLIHPMLCGLTVFCTAKAFAINRRMFQFSLVILSLVLLGSGKELSTTTMMWFAGAANYIYPAIPVMCFAWALRRIHWEGKPITRGALMLLPVLAFVSGATMEQWGMIAVGVSVLLPLASWYQTKFCAMDSDSPLPFASRRLALTICCFLGSVAGVASVFLAPGNFRRLSVAVRPFFENFVVAQTMMLNTRALLFPVTLLLGVLLFWLLRPEEKRPLRILERMAALGLLIGYAVTLFLLFHPTITFKTYPWLDWVWRGYDVLFLAVLIYIPLKLFIKKDRQAHFALCPLVLGLGSYYMLLAASYIWRTLMPALFLLSIWIAFTLARTSPPSLGRTHKAITAVSFLLAFVVFFGVLRGHYLNSFVLKENEARAQAYLQAQDFSKPLFLRFVVDPRCSNWAIMSDNKTAIWNGVVYRYGYWYMILPQGTMVLYENEDPKA
ncbi:MAG: DUF6056 family protein [Oscillospiraceae bacterium]|nr:DUF6056 family protein [Oscillospiraceae bacterium]